MSASYQQELSKQGKPVSVLDADCSSISTRLSCKKFEKLEKENSKYQVNCICPVCSKMVFANEPSSIFGSSKYHKQCFRCVQCQRTLEKDTYKSDGKQLYCFKCYEEEILTSDGLQVLTTYTDKTPRGFFEDMFEITDLAFECIELTRRFRISFTVLGVQRQKFLNPTHWKLPGNEAPCAIPESANLEKVSKRRVSSRKRGATTEEAFEEFRSCLTESSPSLQWTSRR